MFNELKRGSGLESFTTNNRESEVVMELELER
jgi:hypothetical protein